MAHKNHYYSTRIMHDRRQSDPYRIALESCLEPRLLHSIEKLNDVDQLPIVGAWCLRDDVKRDGLFGAGLKQLDCLRHTKALRRESRKLWSTVMENGQSTSDGVLWASKTLD